MKTLAENFSVNLKRMLKERHFTLDDLSQKGCALKKVQLFLFLLNSMF